MPGEGAIPAPVAGRGLGRWTVPGKGPGRGLTEKTVIFLDPLSRFF